MSIALMTLAFRAALPSTPKFVLVALCDSANDQGECYPSIPAVAEKCSLGVRTVQEAIAMLESSGFLRREFRNGRSTVYWITPSSGATPHPRSSRTPAAAAPPQIPHPTPADTAPPPPQQPHPTPAAAAPITVIEPSRETSGNQKKKRAASAPALQCPEDVELQTWGDWLELRAKKRAPVTVTVLVEARREAEKAGMTLARFLAIWCARGTQGLQADWLKPHERAGPVAERGYRRGAASDAEREAANAAANAEAKRLLFGDRSPETIDV